MYTSASGWVRSMPKAAACSSDGLAVRAGLGGTGLADAEAERMVERRRRGSRSSSPSGPSCESDDSAAVALEPGMKNRATSPSGTSTAITERKRRMPMYSKPTSRPSMAVRTMLVDQPDGEQRADDEEELVAQTGRDPTAPPAGR